MKNTSFNQRSNRSSLYFRTQGVRRSGVTYLELILAMPVLLVFLASVIEFGLIMANLKYLPAASRAGAKVVAETPVASIDDLATLTAARDAANDVLAAADLVSCRVIISHNFGGGGSQASGTCTCSAPTTPTLPTDGDGAVRVTVCVELSRLAPDLLSIFGFSTSGRIVQSTTTYPYEDPP